MTGCLLCGGAFAAPITLPGALGRLCVGGRLGRFVQQVQNVNARARESAGQFLRESSGDERRSSTNPVAELPSTDHRPKNDSPCESTLPEAEDEH